MFCRSLYEEDCLLFATLLCLNIQAEGGENFTNEEMSLLLQGILLFPYLTIYNTI
jgi:hypothetical protein